MHHATEGFAVELVVVTLVVGCLAWFFVDLRRGKLAEARRERDEARAALKAHEDSQARRGVAQDEAARAFAWTTEILDSTAASVMKIGADWSILFANRDVRRRIPHLQVGDTFWDVFPEAVSPHSRHYLRVSMDERVETTYETYYPPNDEWFRVNVSPTTEGITMVSVAITEQKKLEERIAAERAVVFTQLSSVMESTAQGIMKLSRDWTIEYGNRVACEILPDLIVGKSYWECFPTVRGKPSEEHLQRAMAGARNCEWESFYEPKQEWFAVQAYPTDDGLSLFFIPITRRKQMEEELAEERLLREKRIEALSVLAGGLAHEISNPLAIIHGTASDLERLAADEPSTAGTAEMLRASKSIVNTSERASRILRGLRSFAREADSDPMELASIYDIVDEVVQMQEARFERHEVELRLELQPGIPPLLCRETQVGQIITNLMNNSFDALTQHECADRWIKLEAGVEGKWLQFDVVDGGPGIDEEVLKRLMEAFFTTKGRGVGMGVGLSLSRSMANDHGGTLELRPGRRPTRFPPAAAAGRCSAGRHGRRCMKLAESKVMIVDDETELREMFAQWLRRCGCAEVRTAGNGAEALEAIAGSPVDAIVSDVRMPVMTGVEMVRALAERDVRAACLVCVSAAGDLDQREMYELGVGGFLSKPFRLEELKAALERSLAEREELWQTPWVVVPQQRIRCETDASFQAAAEAGGSFRLGHGGFSARTHQPLFLGKIAFDCSFEAGEPALVGQGHVRWRSRTDDAVGIEFAYLESPGRERVVQHLRRTQPRSYIPAL